MISLGYGVQGVARDALIGGFLLPRGGDTATKKTCQHKPSAH